MTRRAALLAILFALSACGRKRDSDNRPSAVFRDATGAEVRVRQPVRRIVTTVPGLTETVIALGLRDSLVAVSDQDTGIPEVAALPRIRVFPGIQAEALAEFAPDLVLVDPTFSPRDIEPLRKRFPVFAADSRSLDGLRETFLRLGEALGGLDAARRLADELDAARHAVASTVRHANLGFDKGMSVLLLAEAEPVIALGPGSLLDDMLRACGATNVAADIGRPSGALSSEKIRERAPDWILLAGGAFPDSQRAAWASVPAVRNWKVADATANDLVRAGPRTARALRRLGMVLSGALPPQALGQEER